MSLHEIDLALKASDLILCVKGERIAAFGTPEQVLEKLTIEDLYGLEKGSFNAAFGSVELERVCGTPKVFVVAGNGRGASHFRELQKKQIPFATGILFENDVDAALARALAAKYVITPAFEMPSEKVFDEAMRMMLACKSVIDAGTPIGSLNEMNARLIALAREKGLINKSYEQ